MDTGSRLADSPDMVIKYIKQAIIDSKTIKTKPLNIYISHFHPDHIGGLNKVFVAFRGKIKNIYLPSKDIFSTTFPLGIMTTYDELVLNMSGDLIQLNILKNMVLCFLLLMK